MSSLGRWSALLVALACSTASADTFAPLSPGGTPPSARLGHTAVRDPAGDRMVVFGGGTIVQAQIPIFNPRNDLHVLALAPGSEAWSELSLPGPPGARMFHTCIHDPTRGRVLVFGGLGSGFTPSAELWELSLAAGSEAWRLMAPAGPGPAARFAHAAVHVPALDAMVVHGGYTTLLSRPTDELWTLSLQVGDGAWSQAPAGGGPQTGAHQMALDTTATPDRLLLFGVGDIVGQTTSPDVHARSFPLASSSWTTVPLPAPRPSARQGLAAIVDLATGPPRWLALGGGILDLATSQTGEYPGDAYVLDVAQGSERWDALVPAQGPSRTAGWSAIHDAGRGRAILFGGRDGNGDSNAVYALSLGTSYGPGIASVTPDEGNAGESLIVTIVGTGTAWASGVSMASLGPEVRVNRLVVTGPGRAEASITIQAGALDGPRNVGVITGGSADTAIGPFRVRREARNILVGAGLADANPNRARAFDALGRPVQTDVTAYSAGRWGVNVGAGDLEAEGDDDVLTGPGPGPVLGPQVKAFERDGSPIAKVNFFAYGTLKFGCGVAGGSTDGDGFAEIVTGAGGGAVFGPHVRGFDYDATAVAPNPKVSFFAYGTLRYGVKAVVADVDRDGYGELPTVPGPGPTFGAQVRAFGVDGGAATPLNVNFFAFTGTAYGANVAGGDVDADDAAELVVAKGPGPTAAHDAAVRGFDHDGVAIAPVPGLSFTAFPAGQLFGARVGAGSFLLRLGDELLAGGGPDPAATAEVRMYAYDAATPGVSDVGRLDAFPGQAFGVNVVIASLGL